MEKDKRKIRILAVDISLNVSADNHTEKINEKIKQIEKSGGIVLGMESYPYVDCKESWLRTIITYKI